ncbi:hypothetical protein L1987_63611 [Smallanthus sonchifolius]|uniref:Uncharacterized protein n=1 Tax=Smallanthus sonchifolius TaxID=185202 RepID=A0ACB9CDL7_9ASTR|nr:hypothetical protein L1987_63611 [Smallanthus sonchifolius]
MLIFRGCYFQEEEHVKMNMSIETAYRKSIETVLDWISKEVDTNKTQLIFRSFSPMHFRFRGGDWKSGGSCHLETLPDPDVFPQYSWISVIKTREWVIITNKTRVTERDLYVIQMKRWAHAWNELLYVVFLKREYSLSGSSTAATTASLIYSNNRSLAEKWKCVWPIPMLISFNFKVVIARKKKDTKFVLVVSLDDHSISSKWIEALRA